MEVTLKRPEGSTVVAGVFHIICSLTSCHKMLAELVRLLLVIPAAAGLIMIIGTIYVLTTLPRPLNIHILVRLTVVFIFASFIVVITLTFFEFAVPLW